MSARPKMFFVGGFLGAGKTTAIRALVKSFAARGLKAAVITNDQAAGLVDTSFLADSGIPAEEVAGSCFCCNFNGLADAVKQSIATASPDVILAEPVGSCTDIVATVIRPMRALMKDSVDMYAYSVLVEPDRLEELTDRNAPWSMKYLFDKQLQEADFVVITKLDTLSKERAEEMLKDIARLYPHARVLGISSKEGQGLEDWLDLVEATSPGDRWLKEIDYQIYAEAEAQMGWLNGLVTLDLPEETDGKAVTARFLESLTRAIGERNGKIGHLKLLAVGPTGSVKVGVTRVGEHPVADGTFTGPTSHLQVTVNMRATLSPGDLSAILHEAADECRDTDKADVDIAAINTFRPGAPNPTYRYGGNPR